MHHLFSQGTDVSCEILCVHPSQPLGTVLKGLKLFLIVTQSISYVNGNSRFI
ncbi:hypothetical protein Bsel_1670 [[Bacillus] selenitireducens MLS10]|uniref:Uncharacterized protein n=1 Tax=Bacillus selenitireducens (strain ATCC 700615 / DSM 15326 / MLS10) TaxID=439292 RepID=D6XTP2_BACIE|nr:hypothetical protein Bsel_1670 [[Bacillus] selenitireducens MLS10]